MTPLPAVADPAADLDHVERLLTAAHPALHRFVTEEELHARFEAERAHLRSLAHPTQLDEGAALHRVLARVGDAHLLVALPVYQPTSTAAVSLLPVSVRTVEGRVLVDAATAAWPVGTELVAIDGEPVESALASLAALVPADGRDPVAIRRSLEHDLQKWWALGRGVRDTYVVTVRLPSGERAEQALAGVDRAGARALVAARRTAGWTPSPAPDPLPTLVRAAGRVILRVPTFGVGDTAAFRERVDALLGTVDPDEPLVIDLRGNEGGLRTNANAVLDHLMPGPYAEWTAMRAVTRELPEPLRADLQFLAGTDRQRLRPAFRGPRGPDGWTVDGDPLAATPPPGARSGPLEVWVDGRTGSAANGFALIVASQHPTATVVGERTGGGCDAHVGELPVVWTSPRTGVAVMFSMLALTHVAAPGCVPGLGLPPDVEIVPTLGDFLAGRDPWAR